MTDVLLSTLAENQSDVLNDPFIRTSLFDTVLKFFRRSIEREFLKDFQKHI